MKFAHMYLFKLLPCALIPDLYGNKYLALFQTFYPVHFSL